jgi:hypothetical protein
MPVQKSVTGSKVVGSGHPWKVLESSETHEFNDAIYVILQLIHT